MERSLHNVSNLSGDARSLVESLVGHPLPDDQSFYIVTLDSGSEPSQQQRDEAWEELEAMMTEMRRNAAASGLSHDEIDKVIDDTCEEVRYGRAS